jgi:hypothetical protein
VLAKSVGGGPPAGVTAEAVLAAAATARPGGRRAA